MSYDQNKQRSEAGAELEREAAKGQSSPNKRHDGDL